MVFRDEHTELLKMRGRRFARGVIDVRMKEPPSVIGHAGLRDYLLEEHKRLVFLYDMVLPKLKVKVTDEDVEGYYSDKKDKLFRNIAEDSFQAQSARDTEMKRRAEHVRNVFFRLFQPECKGKRLEWDDTIESPVEGVDAKIKLKDEFTGPNWAADWVSDSPDEQAKYLVDRYGDGDVLREFYFTGQLNREHVSWKPTIKSRLRVPKVK